MRFNSKIRASIVLAVMLALGAFASASASAALPEFVPNGTEKESVEAEFTSGNFSGSIVLNNESGPRIYCFNASGYMYIDGSKEFRFGHMNLSECQLELSGGRWTCENNKSGRIETNALSGKLGYVQKEPTKIVALSMLPEKEPFASSVVCFNKFGSIFRNANITGGVLGAVEPLNKSGGEFTVKLESGTSIWEQKILHFEGEITSHSLTWERPMAMVSTLTFKHFKRGGSATALEIKA